MKGTIDVQIKHKDGSIETRHEHNVVFDLPAEVMKTIAKVPVLGLRSWTYRQLASDDITQYIFPSFSLCEDIADLTRPKYLPCSLTTTRSSSSSWFTPAVTITTNDKSITAQASWTLGEAMTIKSIRVMGNYEPDVSRFYSNFQVIDDTGTLSVIGQGGHYGKRLSAADFKFTNPTNIMRLVPKSEQDSNTSYVTLPMYYSYPLVNNERFAIIYGTNSDPRPLNGASVSIYSNDVPTAKIQIFNASTGNMVREFPISQFSGFATTVSEYFYTFVVNTGTKNILIRVRGSNTGDDPHIKCWQIPDTPTQDTIPAVEITFPDNFPTYPQAILDNYILYGTYSAASVIKLNDDLSITTYKGLLNGRLSWNKNYSPRGYMPTGLTFLIDSTTIYYPNLTAANFSTPIELAEGDVLTVSYKIEVS